MIEVPMICVDNGYDLLHQSKFEHSNKVAVAKTRPSMAECKQNQGQ